MGIAHPKKFDLCVGAMDSVRSFARSYQRLSIWFTPSVTDKLGSFVKALTASLIANTSQWEKLQAAIRDEINMRERHEVVLAWHSLVNKHNSEINAALAAIENDFRALLGVVEKA